MLLVKIAATDEHSSWRLHRSYTVYSTDPPNCGVVHTEAEYRLPHVLCLERFTERGIVHVTNRPVVALALVHVHEKIVSDGLLVDLQRFGGRDRLDDE